MSPLQRSNNIAARMGRWSATHRKKAIFGWLAFVVLSVAIGAFVGTKQIDQNNSNVGEAHRADQMLLDAGFQIDPQTEFVLIQSKTRTFDDAAFKSVVQDTIVAVQPHRAVFTNLKSPLDPRNRTQVSNDGHTALVEFTMKGTDKAGEEGHRPGRQGNRRRPGEAPRLLRLRGRLDLHGQGARQALQLAARECR